MKAWIAKNSRGDIRLFYERPIYELMDDMNVTWYVSHERHDGLHSNMIGEDKDYGILVDETPIFPNDNEPIEVKLKIERI